MNIAEELMKKHSKQQAITIADYACASKDNFKKLMQCFDSNDYVLAQRAAWSVTWATRKKPELILPYIKNLVAVLSKKNVHDAVVRNAVRILETIDIPEAYHGEVMNACFNFIENPATAVAIKAFSLTTLYNLSATYPEIKAELKLIIEEKWDTETAAFKSRGRKILALLNKKSGS